MAHKKGVGSSRNGRDSNPKYRGVKKFGGESVVAGNVIIRQCGTKWHPGKNVGLGRDYTIYSLIDGVVKFEPVTRNKRRISVYPPDVYPVGGAPKTAPAEATAAAAPAD